VRRERHPGPKKESAKQSFELKKRGKRAGSTRKLAIRFGKMRKKPAEDGNFFTWRGGGDLSTNTKKGEGGGE